jgi:hypothetical protein
MIFLLPLLTIFSSFAFNQEELGNRFHLGVGFDLFETQYKEQRYKFQKYQGLHNPVDHTISRVAWNASYRITKDKPFYIGLRTNRGINFPIQQQVYDTVAKQNVRIDIKSEVDSLYLATAVHKRVLPFIIASRLQSKSTVYYNSGLNFTTRGLTAMYGFGLATPLGNKGTISFTYYLPNKEFNTKRMFGISVNYFLI